MKYTKVNCNHCNILFDKENKAFNRSKKLDRKHYCSFSCASKDRIINNPKLKKNIKSGSECDQFSPFRKQLSSAKSRAVAKSLELDITLQDLLDLYELQEGKCALSGIKMIIRKNTGESSNKDPFMMSLDRIDPKRGYLKDNIQWVCLIGQFAKNTFTEEDLLKFCRSVCNHIT
jgi:hypothetical protein